MKNLASCMCALALGVVFLLGGRLQAQAVCPARAGDDAAVADTIRGMYNAAMANDRAKVDSFFADGFYMFDNGKRFNGDAIMDTMQGFYAKGVKFVWTVTQPDVHIHCDQAWIAYVNRGSIQMGPDAKPVPTEWLESAVLERQHGAWKMVFFQSTRVPPEAATSAPAAEMQKPSRVR